MNNNEDPATHSLRTYALSDAWTDTTEDYATEAEANQAFSELLEAEGWSGKDHPEGGWICFDDVEEVAAILIVAL